VGWDRCVKGCFGAGGTGGECDCEEERGAEEGRGRSEVEAEEEVRALDCEGNKGGGDDVPVLLGERKRHRHVFFRCCCCCCYCSCSFVLSYAVLC